MEASSSITGKTDRDLAIMAFSVMSATEDVDGNDGHCTPAARPGG